MDITLDYEEQAAKIRVIGVGGGGGNAVKAMKNSHLKGVTFIVANTDVQALAASNADTRIQIGRELTGGLGAGAKPEIGKGAAEESIEDIREAIGDANMVFITAGMGGGTGTGAAPVIARAAKEKGILTVGVVTKPFQHEGPRRMKAAEQGIAELSEHVDSLIVIPNNRLLNSGAKNARFLDMLNKANDVLYCAVRGITDLITSPGFINADFADVKTVMEERGMALMGTGRASGEHRALEAAKSAVSSSLLEDVSIQGAKAILVNITSTSDLLMDEYNEAASYITDLVGTNAEIIIGMAVDESAGEDITITVVATGLEMNPLSIPTPSNHQNHQNHQAHQAHQSNTIEYSQPVQANQQLRQVYNSQPHLTQLNTSQAMHTAEDDLPAYLRKRQSRLHRPGADDFVFSDDESDLPTFIHRQAN